jgi:peroxiredoxin
LAELRSLLKKDENVKLYGISIDPPDVSKTFAAKIASDKKGELNFPLLSDPGHRVIDAYGVRNPAYDNDKNAGTPHPAVYVIDKDGKVAWVKVESDYKNRPGNAEIRAALDKL